MGETHPTLGVIHLIGREPKVGENHVGTKTTSVKFSTHCTETSMHRDRRDAGLCFDPSCGECEVHTIDVKQHNATIRRKLLCNGSCVTASTCSAIDKRRSGNRLK